MDLVIAFAPITLVAVALGAVALAALPMPVAQPVRLRTQAGRRSL